MIGCMANRKKILLVGDQPGWAFHNIIQFVQSHLKTTFDIYFDFTVYHPAYEDPNKEISSRPIKILYKKDLFLQKIPVLRGIEYRLIRMLNQLNLISFNEHGKFQRIRKDNSYDAVVYLDYYFLFDGDFRHVKADKIIQGTFSDIFPPRKLVRIPQTGEIKQIIDGFEFCNTFLDSANALLIGAPSIKAKYEPYFSKPIVFANMAYSENVSKDNQQHKVDTSKFIIGWTGNPDREFKGFHKVIVPAIEKLQSMGYHIELKTQFEGSIESLASFWQGVDLAVIASGADAGPSMFMEASLCSVPSVSTRIGMPANVIRDGENGLFCERNVEDLTSKIAYLMDHPELLKSMKARIRKDYIEKLGVEVQVNNWKKLFYEVLNHA